MDSKPYTPPPVEPRVGIFWDYENCAPPANVPGYIVTERIRDAAHQFGSVTIFKAYLELSTTNISAKMINLRSELQSSGVSLTDCPRESNRKEVVDKMLMVDMLTFAMDNPAPAVVMLISGDRDFVYAISVLRHRKYSVVLVVPSQGAHITLRSQATVELDWKYDIFADNLQPDGSGSGRAESSISGDNKLSSTGESSLGTDEKGKKRSPATPPRTLTPARDLAPEYDMFSPMLRSPGIQQELPHTPPRRTFDLSSAIDINEPPPSHRRTRSTTIPKPPGPTEPPRMFNNLIDLLEEWRLMGNEQPLRSQVAMELMKKNPMLYGRVGVRNFSEYVRAAEKASVVKLGATGVPGAEWITLVDAYKGKIYPVYPGLQSP